VKIDALLVGENARGVVVRSKVARRSKKDLIKNQKERGHQSPSFLEKDVRCRKIWRVKAS
jgi:hypothetical protein